MPKDDDPRVFFLVWSPQGGPPVVRIRTFAEARVAALRLGTKFPDRDFFVLRSCWGKAGQQPAIEELAGDGPSGETGETTTTQEA